ncbi:MAG: hypothetical protein HY901_04270, partial [Deltaproteobacteria bacterium]|nr:hypothetical protein [Deltaproteobacteria bacterium]
MKPVSAPLVVCICLLLSTSASAADLQAARQKLEAARTNLAKAVQLIEKDPPATADLDAAHEAVKALKDAIDAGAAFETEDLEFARSALVARKELRTQREFVQERRAKVHIHEGRRTLEAAAATLSEKAARVAGKDPGEKDFADARAAAAALRKALDTAREFVGQDEKFGRFVADTEAAFSKTEKALDERVTQLTVEKQRAALEESRRALASSVGALSKGSTDADFESADKASATLAKRLDEGKALEDKDKGYRADAEKARAELSQSKKKADDLWSTSRAERLKAEIEPSHKDLKEAGTAIRARTATADQLAEARTAAIIVRKLLEEFQPQAARSQVFAQYLAEVQKTLNDVEGELARRSLDSVVKAATAALRPVDGRAPTAEQLDAATAALATLEKTLVPLQRPDPAIAAQVADARELLRSGRANLEKRRLGLDLQRQRARVEEARKRTTGLMRLQTLGKEQVTELEAALKQVLAALDEGTALTKKDREYAVYAVEVRKRVREGEAQLARRKVEIDVLAAKAKVEEARKRWAGFQAQLGRLGEEQLKEAETSLMEIAKALDEGNAVTKIDSDYASYASEVRKRVTEGVAQIAKSKVGLLVQAAKAKVEEARKKWAGFQARLGRIGEEQIKEAEETLQQIAKALDEGSAVTRIDKDYAFYDGEVRKRVAEGEAQIVLRKLVLEVLAAKTMVEEARKKWAGFQAQLGRLGNAEVKEAEESLKQVTQALD